MYIRYCYILVIRDGLSFHYVRYSFVILRQGCLKIVDIHRNLWYILSDLFWFVFRCNFELFALDKQSTLVFNSHFLSSRNRFTNFYFLWKSNLSVSISVLDTLLKRCMLFMAVLHNHILFCFLYCSLLTSGPTAYSYRDSHDNSDDWTVMALLLTQFTGNKAPPGTVFCYLSRFKDTIKHKHAC